MSTGTLFFIETAATEIYTLSLHDALPIFTGRSDIALNFDTIRYNGRTYQFAGFIDSVRTQGGETVRVDRSEEHTSELQSQSNLVCRLLLEKKKNSSTQQISACELRKSALL